MKKPSNFKISAKHQRQLDRAEGRALNVFWDRFIEDTLQGYLDGKTAALPHIFGSEMSNFSHENLELLLSNSIQQTGGPIDFAMVQTEGPLFTNPLTEATFDSTKVKSGERSGFTAPSLRIVNGGWCCYTFEFDGDDQADLEMQLDWFSGKPDACAFAKVGRALSKFPDYRGYSAVFSGNKSVHIHIIFDLKHLDNSLCSSPNSAARAMWKGNVPPDFIGALHHRVWAEIATIINTTLGTDITFDPRLRSYIQKRRTPWGIRTFTKESALHGFFPGDEVVQTVLQEHILSRASANSVAAPLQTVDKAMKVEPSFWSSQNKPSARVVDEEAQSEAIIALQDHLTASGWKEYPKPILLTFDGVHNFAHFLNHPGDRNPSTFVRGDHRRLVPGGRKSPVDDVFLPDDLTLDDTIDLLIPAAKMSTAAPVRRDPSTRFRPSGAFQAKATSKENARKALPGLLSIYAPMVGPTLVLAPEGIGKTYALMNMISELCWDEDAEYFSRKSSTRSRGFNVIACKSYLQCDEKMQECRNVPNSTGRVLTLPSFSKLYDDARMILDEDTKITREQAGACGFPSLVHAIKNQQPDVFAKMSVLRDEVWKVPGMGIHFDADIVVLMVHAVLQNWQHSLYARAFLHPEFPDDLDQTEIERCRDEMRVRRVIYDEVESSDLVSIFPDWSVKLAKDVEKTCTAAAKKPWDEASLSDRVEAFSKTLANQGRSADDQSYDVCDQIIRTKFVETDKFAVDTARFPFGKGDDRHNFYAKTDGKKYYCKARRWFTTLNVPIMILTTELMPMLIARGINKKKRDSEPDSGPMNFVIRGVSLINTPHLPSEIVPLKFDERARMPRQNDPTKECVTTLAEELLSGDVDFVISNGLSGLDKTLITKTSPPASARGRNDLADKPIASFITYPTQHQYEEHCILGAALGIDNPTAVVYRDLLYQNLGRNLGFRAPKGVTEVQHTVYIKSSLFKNLMQFKGENLNPSVFDRYRFRLVK